MVSLPIIAEGYGGEGKLYQVGLVLSGSWDAIGSTGLSGRSVIMTDKTFAIALPCKLMEYSSWEVV